jgi:serine/threonine protein kinase/tetratricopeptide (TPR) repeat protein
VGAGDQRVTGTDDTVAASDDPVASQTEASSSGATGAPQLAFGRYEILGLLGAGGMGSVYRARDTRLDEVVALKVLRRELVDQPGIVARFTQEAKLARKVTHKNVARTFDLGEHEGERFLTMEYVDGESLGGVLSRLGLLPLARTIQIAIAICDGLSAAHAANVVHRDLKPDNVLIAADGRVLITDFGIARAFAQGGAARTSGGFVGTPAYMAPEQVEGASDIGHRADLYALGALLFEMLTGSRAWPGEEPLAVALARLARPTPDPCAVRAEITESLGGVVRKLMARRAEHRFASAEEVAAALRAATPTFETAPTLAETTGPDPRRAHVQVPMLHATANGEKTVAVLPIRNAGPPDDDYVADGLTEDLIDTLSMTRGLRVRPRGVVTRVRSHDRDPRDVGRELDVQAVVEGSVRRAGAAYRVSARVIGVADGFQLWARRFDRPTADLLVVSDEVARSVAEALTAHIGAPAREAPTDAAAVDLYLRARVALRDGWHSSEEIVRASGLFEEARLRAPADVAILAGCAIARARLAFYGGPDARLSMERAREAAERAVEAAPHLGEGWIALAMVHSNAKDFGAAVRALHEALRASPNLARAHEMLGRILLEVGAVDEGIARLEAALSFDPTTVEPRWDLARGYALRGEWERCDAILALPAVRLAERTARAVMIGRMAIWRMRKGHALALSLGDVGDDVPRLLIEPYLEIARTRTVTAECRASYEREAGVAGAGTRRYPVVFQFLTEVLLAVEDVDGAADAVARAVAGGLSDLAWMDRCPLLVPLRAAASWAALRADVAERASRVLRAASA